MTLAVQCVLREPGREGPSEKGFVAPANRGSWMKPMYRTALWTSTYLGPEQISDWARWCRSEGFGCGEHRLWLLTPRPTANLIVIDSEADLRTLLNRPGQHRTPVGESFARIDFEALASEGIDGVHLTEGGQIATHLSFPGLYGWDAESTCWLRWAFDDVMDGGLVTIEAEEYE